MPKSTFDTVFQNLYNGDKTLMMSISENHKDDGYMTTNAQANLSTNIDWSNFNSTVVIEVTRPEGIFTSTGVAINKDTILTAAHCLEGEILKVRVSTAGTYNKNGKFLGVKTYELHPEYEPELSNYKCDLAKIKLSSPLPEGTNFYSVLKNDRDLTGNFVRIGYGARGDKNIRTMITPVFKEVQDPQKILELHDMYSYSGDSGGPVFLQQKGQLFLVAIHSTLSYGPEGKYSYNPLLAAHRTWIYA
ncbi:MAG: trypsin-like serine protease [Bdellovibrionota bacterium]